MPNVSSHIFIIFARLSSSTKESNNACVNPTMVDAHRAEDGVLVEVIKMMVVDVMEVAVHKIAIAGMNGKPPFEFLASCCLFE